MNDKEIIRALLAMRGWSQSKLAAKAGYKRQSNIGDMLTKNKQSVRVDNFAKLLNVMGCKLIVVDEMGSKKEWEVSFQDKEKD